MVGPRGPAFLMLCFPIICQVEAQTKVFIVNGAGFRDGVYTEEGERGDHYQRLGGANSYDYYSYLYRETGQAGTWVVGKGKSFETREAVFRATLKVT